MVLRLHESVRTIADSVNLITRACERARVRMFAHGHARVCVCARWYMRRHDADGLATIGLDFGIQCRALLVRVDSDEDERRVCVDPIACQVTAVDRC